MGWLGEKRLLGHLLSWCRSVCLDRRRVGLECIAFFPLHIARDLRGPGVFLLFGTVEGWVCVN